MDIIKRSLEHGAKYPYDGGSDFWSDKTQTPTPSIDWAHAAARGVLADLLDRRGIKWAFQDEQIDSETRAEIVLSMSKIIRMAHDLRESLCELTKTR